MMSDRYLPLITLTTALTQYPKVTSTYRGPCVLAGTPDPPVGTSSGTLLVWVSHEEGDAVVLLKGASSTLEVAVSKVLLDLADESTRTLVDLLLARIVFPERLNSHNVVVGLAPDPLLNVSYFRVASGVYWSSQGLRISRSWQTEVDTTDPILARLLVWDQIAAGTLSF